MTIMLDADTSKPNLWPAYRTRFHLNRLPDPAVRIFAARYESEEGHASRFPIKTERRPKPVPGEWFEDGARILKATWTLGKVLFFVSVCHDGERDESMEDYSVDTGRFEQQLHRIWPVDFTFDWPCAGSGITPADYEEVTTYSPAA